MAAGQGFKTFANGEVLSAADVNGYLMQGVLVFADAAARTAAITSPQEGQTVYLKSDDKIYSYSGSAWVQKSGGSPLTTKGDLYTYSTQDARLAVGTNGQVLTADSAEATGMKWATSASGGMTLLSTTTLSGTSVTVSSIPSTYKDLSIRIYGATAGSNNGDIYAIFNSVNSYEVAGVRNNDGTVNSLTYYSNSNTGTLARVTTSGSVAYKASVSLDIPDYSSSYPKRWQSFGMSKFSTEVLAGYISNGNANMTAAISSITIGGDFSFTGGTLLIYGVS